MRTASTGMLAQQMQVDSIANNIANVNTTAFKKDQLAFRSLLYRTYRDPGAMTSTGEVTPTGLQIGGGVEVSSSVKLHFQGDLEPTGNPLDLAINGEGFFRILMGNGDFRYTRDGSFRRDVNGDLVTVDGYRMQPAITIDPEAEGIAIAQDGTVTVTFGDGTSSEVGQIALFRFANPAGLKADGANLFLETESSGPATQSEPGDESTGLLRQGFRERSNVQIVDELIELIQAQRNYEVNSRTIRVADEMLQQVSNLVR